MNWWKFGVVAWICFSVLVSIGSIGKPRKPLTPGVTVVSVVISAVLMFCVVRA